MSAFRVEYSRAKKEQRDGLWFDSAAEAELYDNLRARLQSGEISKIETQVSLKLSMARFIYRADFKVTYPDGHIEFEEMKGYETDTWKRNRRLWQAGYGPFPGAKLVIWKKNRRGIYIWKTIISPGGQDS